MDTRQVIKYLEKFQKNATTDKRETKKWYFISKEEEKALKLVISLLEDCV